MIYGVLKDNESSISFVSLDNEESILETLQGLVDGEVEYIPLKNICPKLPKELNPVCLVINDAGKTSTKCRPNLLLEGDMIVGNVAFVNTKKQRKKIKTVGLTTEQIDLLPTTINDFIISEDLKETFGV